MMKEDFLTAAELQALLAGNEEYSEELVEDLDSQDLKSLQKTVKLLSKQVKDLQLQLHEQLELQNRQQEQFLRLCRHELENKLREQLVNTIVIHQHAGDQEEHAALHDVGEGATLDVERVADTKEEEPQLTFSRVKSYSKIRKRKKGFLEKLFE